MWKKLRSHPYRYAKNALYKLVIAPLKYRKGDDYDAERYWRDRLSKYGASLLGPGDEGLSEADNELMYGEAADVLACILSQEGIDLAGCRVLEIGCGNGYFTGFLYERGVRNYLGVDITDTMFPQFEADFPEFTFLKSDVTGSPIGGEFDLVLMLDVIQHIVTKPRLSAAIRNARDALASGGVFLISPLKPRTARHLFHVKWWSFEEIEPLLGTKDSMRSVPFRYDRLLIVRRSPATREFPSTDDG